MKTNQRTGKSESLLRIAFVVIIVSTSLMASSGLNIARVVQASTYQAFNAVILSNPELCNPICGPLPYENVLVQNTQTYSVTVNIFLVMHNSIMQTMFVGTSSFTIPAGQNLTAFVFITLPEGNYTANMFAWYLDGSPASNALRNVSINTSNL